MAKRKTKLPIKRKTVSKKPPVLSFADLQPIPKDTGDFEEIRTAEIPKLYVDKTDYLHRLITDQNASRFFLARPRRFGKSLMITTLKAIFEGRRDLFKGLKISRLKYDWKKHPVLRFNFGFAATPCGLEAFKSMFRDEIERVLGEVGVAYDPKREPGSNFARAIDKLAAKAAKGEGRLPVVLIDEYDDPVAKVIDKVKVAEDVRDYMAGFYGQIKDRTGKIRFLMITGVSKFTKMSIFSTLSNLVDLSFEDEYSTMLGYTEAELDEYFTERMHLQAKAMGLTDKAYREELRRNYNGYRFFKKRGEKVYNPVSINLNLARCDDEFDYYWSSTGRPSTLMNVIKRGDMLAIDPEHLKAVSAVAFDVTDLRKLKPVAMLYQTGYLTISGYDIKTKQYKLCVPDEEVRRDLSLVFASVHADKDVAWAAEAGGCLLNGDFESFFDALQSLYSGAAYGSTEQSVHEASFARNLQFLLAGQGFRMTPERTTSDGRIDLVADHPCGTYIFELKVVDNMRPRAAAVLKGASAKRSSAVASTARELAANPAAFAMSQIKAKRYAAPYAAADKPVWLVGLAFHRKTRCFIAGEARKLGKKSVICAKKFKLPPPNFKVTT